MAASIPKRCARPRWTSTFPKAAPCSASASNSTAKATRCAGQNERSFPVVIQYIDDKSYVVWPKSQAQREAVLPLPAGTTYSYK